MAFNDIKSAAKAHHAKNSLGEVTLRTDYWEGSTGTVVLNNANTVTGSGPPSGNSGNNIRGVGGPGPGGNNNYNGGNPSSSLRPVSSTFSSWAKT